MKRTSEAVLAGLLIASMPACYETAYGGAGFFETPVTQMGLVDSRPDALADSPSGGWRWVDGGWRWYPRAALTAQPTIAPQIATPPKDVAVRVNVSITTTTASREPVVARFDVTARGSSQGSMPPVIAQFAVTRSNGASLLAAPDAAPAPPPTLPMAAPTINAARTVEPATPVPATPAVMTISPPEPIGATAIVPVVARSAGPEEIRPAPAAGDLSSTTDGHDLAITVVPMRTNSPRWRRAGAHGF